MPSGWVIWISFGLAGAACAGATATNIMKKEMANAILAARSTPLDINYSPYVAGADVNQEVS